MFAQNNQSLVSNNNYFSTITGKFSENTNNYTYILLTEQSYSPIKLELANFMPGFIFLLQFYVTQHIKRFKTVSTFTDV